MALAHKTYDVRGVQFHPESVLTPDGEQMLKNWLEKYAPDSVKFHVQEVLPNVDLSHEAAEFLSKLADTIEAEKDLNGQGMHDAIYAAAEVAGMKTGQAFVALYRVILGQDSGPKAGWFLASLDREWLVRRLQEAGAHSR